MKIIFRNLKIQNQLTIFTWCQMSENPQEMAQESLLDQRYMDQGFLLTQKI